MPAPSEPPVPSHDERAYKYAAFLSYRRKVDAEVAQEILRALETYRIPPAIQKQHGAGKRCGRVFKDEDELDAASSLPAALKDALEASKFLIVICSPDARDSPWIQLEIEHFLSLGRDARILAVLVRGEPSDSFPRALQRMPLAVDLRADSPRARRRRLARERLRLLARMIGCDFDALVRRDAQRSVRRLEWAAASAALVAVAAVGILAYVVKLRATAEERRVAAESRLAAASRAMDRINYLIENRINAGTSGNDLKPDLVRLVTETQATLVVTGGAGRDEHLVEMTMHRSRAEIAESHGDYTTASEEYLATLTLGEAALMSAPADLPLRQDVAVSHGRLAALARTTGDQKLSSSELAVALRETAALLHDAPTNTNIRANLSGQYVMLGEQQEADRSPQAPVTYAEAVKVGGVHSRDEHFVVELAQPVINAHRHLARIHATKGERDAAIAEYIEARSIAEMGAELFPSMFPPRERVEDTLHLGWLFRSAGRFGDAVKSFDGAVEVLESYRSQHPDAPHVAYDEWVLRGEILVDSVPAGAQELATRLGQYDQIDDAVRRRIAGSTNEVSDYASNALDVSDRLLGLDAVAAAADVARRALRLLNQAVFEDVPWPAGPALFMRSFDALVMALDAKEVTAAAKREVAVCTSRQRPPTETEALRCGYGWVVLATANSRSDLRRAGGDAKRALGMWKVLSNEDSADVLRFRVVSAHLATMLGVAIGSLEQVRPLSESTVAAARKLIALTENGPDDGGKDVDSETLGTALAQATAFLTGENKADERLTLLREAVERLSTAGRHGGALTIMAARCALLYERIKRSEVDEARAEMGAAQELLGTQFRVPPEPSAKNFRWLVPLLQFTQLGAKVAVLMHDKATCVAGAEALSNMAGELVKKLPARSDLLTMAKAMRDECAGMP
jgi:tetratricopeptide (TPR) repeat protein